jgi:hypothetical protein
MDVVEVTLRAKVGGTASYTTLDERFDVRPASLEDVLAILARFHELAERIRDEQAGLAGKPSA